MRKGHLALWVLPFALLVIALGITRCIRKTDPWPVIRGHMMMAAYQNLQADYAIANYVCVHWVSGAGTVEEANDRLPDWADDRDRCYRWEASFQVQNRLSQDALAEGRHEGWITIDRDKETWILELRRINEMSGEDVLVITGWDGPPAEEAGG